MTNEGSSTAEKHTLGVEGRLAGLVLRDLVHLVLLALRALAECLPRLRDVHHRVPAHKRDGECGMVIRQSTSLNSIARNQRAQRYVCPHAAHKRTVCVAGLLMAIPTANLRPLYQLMQHGLRVRGRYTKIRENKVGRGATAEPVRWGAWVTWSVWAQGETTPPNHTPPHPRPPVSLTEPRGKKVTSNLKFQLYRHCMVQ